MFCNLFSKKKINSTSEKQSSLMNWIKSKSSNQTVLTSRGTETTNYSLRSQEESVKNIQSVPENQNNKLNDHESEPKDISGFTIDTNEEYNENLTLKEISLQMSPCQIPNDETDVNHSSTKLSETSAEISHSSRKSLKKLFLQVDGPSVIETAELSNNSPTDLAESSSKTKRRVTFKESKKIDISTILVNGDPDENITKYDPSLEKFELFEKFWNVYMTDEGHKYYLCQDDTRNCAHSQWHDPRDYGYIDPQFYTTQEWISSITK